MERRWATRTPIHVDVGIFYKGGEVGVRKTRDIGLGGVFLEAGELPLPLEAHVELIFLLKSGVQPRKHKIRAKVVRATGDGVGFMFRDFDAITFRSLQEVLRHREHLNEFSN